MTYCAAFVTQDFIILTTDTVEASPKAGEKVVHPTNETFFSEQASFEGFEVSDSALKLFKIDENRLVAAAGQKDLIYEAIRFLRENSSKFTSMEPLFQSLEISTDFQRNAVEIICAEKVENSLILGVWASKCGLSYPANSSGKSADAILIGSAMDGFEYITRNVSHMVASYKADKLSHVLTLVNSYHQLVGVHAPMTRKKFGGAFVSAAVTRQGIVWQPDTTYFIYSPIELDPENAKIETLEAINVLMRRELLYVERRTPTFRNILMHPCLDLQQVKSIVYEFGFEMFNTARNLSSEYKVFLSREAPYGVMLHHFHPEYCLKSEVGDRIAKSTYSVDFYQLLKTQPTLGSTQGAAKIEVVPRGLLSDAYVQPLIESNG